MPLVLVLELYFYFCVEKKQNVKYLLLILKASTAVPV